MRAALLLAALVASPARASNEDVAFGARAAGLADAVTADTGGLGSITENPAALGQLRRAQAEATSRRLFQVPAGPTDLDGMGAAAALPVDSPWLRGAFGAAWDYDAAGAQALDRSVGLSYGTRSWRELGPGTLDVGLTFKTIGRSGRAQGGKTAKAAVDLGSLYRWRDAAVGFSLLNLNGPRTDVGPAADAAPVIAKLGVARAVRRFDVVSDLSWRESTPQRRGSQSWAGGLEYSWATVGAGLWTGRSGLALGTFGKTWSVGLGWRVLGAELDYAARIPLSNGSRWSHVVSLAYRFGAWDPEAEYEKLLSTEMGYRRELSGALEASEVKQWRLAEELRVMKGELEDLRRELEAKTAEAGEAAERAKRAEEEVKLRDLEARRRKAEAELERLRRDREARQKELREADVEGRFKDEWRAYEDLKLQGVANAVLVDRLKNILSEFKGKGVDLSDANEELQKLERQ